MPILDWQGQLRKTDPALAPPGGVFIGLLFERFWHTPEVEAKFLSVRFVPVAEAYYQSHQSQYCVLDYQ